MDTKHPAVAMRFFKVMMPGFLQKLNLPPAVSKELEKCKSKTAILESGLGRWKLDLSRNCENNLICFEQGWLEFVDRHGLSIGDFIVFEPTKSNTQHHLHFNVYVFDSSACEKEFLVETKKVKQEVTKPLNPTAEGGALYFEKTMIPSYGTKTARVYIPREFMRVNNLGKQRSASLKDPEGRSWGVKLNFVSSSGLRQRMYGGGWHDFYAANALKDGDTCVFKLIPPNLTCPTIFFDVDIRRINRLT